MKVDDLDIAHIQFLGTLYTLVHWHHVLEICLFTDITKQELFRLYIRGSYQKYLLGRFGDYRIEFLVYCTQIRLDWYLRRFVVL